MTFPECQTIPWLPSHDFSETTEFYRALGFEVLDDGSEGHLIVALNRIELHFYLNSEPDNGWAGSCYIRTDDLDRLHDNLDPTHIPQEDGIPFYRAPNAEDWGMREFHIVDNSGNLLKFGEPL